MCLIELGQLEKRHEDFARHNTRVVVVSMEGLESAQMTQKQFPHLTVLADEKRGLSQTIDVIHAKASPKGEDIDAPTTIISDRSGTVRWFYRTPAVLARLTPDEVLSKVEETIPETKPAAASQ